MRPHHDKPRCARATLADGRRSARIARRDGHRLLFEESAAGTEPANTTSPVPSGPGSHEALHAWCNQGDLAASWTTRAPLSAGRVRRAALLVAASRALHDQYGVRDQTETGWLRRRVAQMLDLSAEAVDAEFAEDQSLMTVTIAWLARVHLRQQRILADLLATGDFPRWAHAALVRSRNPGPVFGCEIGWLARQPDLAAVDRDLLHNAYCAWQRQLVTALRSLQSRELVSVDTDLQALATTVLCLLQGAYLTACRAQDLSPIEATFDAVARLITGPVDR